MEKVILAVIICVICTSIISVILFSFLGGASYIFFAPENPDMIFIVKRENNKSESLPFFIKAGKPKLDLGLVKKVELDNRVRNEYWIHFKGEMQKGGVQSFDFKVSDDLNLDFGDNVVKAAVDITKLK
ncbi:hypothetical protein EB118_23740 [bacterium]|nr:hypothetical protein [bacterium]NDG33067.1 hypothetical protein [bacterium]